MRAGFAFYWMTNDDWFYFDDDDIGEPHLTAKATPEAIRSFEEHKKMIEEDKKHPHILK